MKVFKYKDHHRYWWVFAAEKVEATEENDIYFVNLYYDVEDLNHSTDKPAFSLVVCTQPDEEIKITDIVEEFTSYFTKVMFGFYKWGDR